MTTFRFLILTDHSRHNKENSLYALAAALVQHPQCAQVAIASRGNASNTNFFYANENIPLQAILATARFTFDPTGKQFQEQTVAVNPSDFDVIFMRLPRPISTDFLSFIAQIASHKVIINDPKGIEKTSSKAYLLNFPHLCPPMALCRSIEQIQVFAQQFPIVLKPLKEYGGKGIVKIDGNQLWIGNRLYDTNVYLQKNQRYIEQEGYLAMKFLKNVSQGDKRILVIDGQILAASVRLPPKGSWMCNVAQGGQSLPAQVTEEETHLIQQISPALKQEGILIFGADTLVNDDGKRILSEINTLSIGGFPQAEAQTGRPIIAQTIQKIIDHVINQSQRKYTNY